VGDVTQFVLDTKPPAKIYVSSLQSPDSSMSLVIRTAGELDELAHGVRVLLAAIDPKLPVSSVKPMDEFIDEQAAGIGIASDLVGSFGFVALVLSAIGIYSLMAYSTSARLTHQSRNGDAPVDDLRERAMFWLHIILSDEWATPCGS
jgi:hypothetical protein